VRTPVELPKRLGVVAEQQVDLRRPQVPLVGHDVVAVIEPQPAEGQVTELADGHAFAGRNDVVVGLLLLKHQPHRPHVVAGKTPVTLRVEIAEVELVLQAELDAGGGPGDLSGHERLAAPRAFVVEQDPARRVQAVALAVVDREPVGTHLGDTVGAARVEWRRLPLGCLGHLAEHLRA